MPPPQSMLGVLEEGTKEGGRATLTGLCRIMDTLFFCSIMLKSCRRSGAMFLSRKYSGSLSSTRSKYLSLCGAVVGGGEVTTAARPSPFISVSRLPAECEDSSALTTGPRPSAHTGRLRSPCPLPAQGRDGRCTAPCARQGSSQNKQTGLTVLLAHRDRDSVAGTRTAPGAVDRSD